MHEPSRFSRVARSSTAGSVVDSGAAAVPPEVVAAGSQDPQTVLGKHERLLVSADVNAKVDVNTDTEGEQESAPKSARIAESGSLPSVPVTVMEDEPYPTFESSIEPTEEGIEPEGPVVGPVDEVVRDVVTSVGSDGVDSGAVAVSSDAVAAGSLGDTVAESAESVPAKMSAKDWLDIARQDHYPQKYRLRNLSVQP